MNMVRRSHEHLAFHGVFVFGLLLGMLLSSLVAWQLAQAGLAVVSRMTRALCRRVPRLGNRVGGETRIA